MSAWVAARFKLFTANSSSSTSPSVKTTEELEGEGEVSLGLPNCGFQAPAAKSWAVKGDERPKTGPAPICRWDRCWRTYSVKEGEEEDRWRELLESSPFSPVVSSLWGYCLGISFAWDSAFSSSLPENRSETIIMFIYHTCECKYQFQILVFFIVYYSIWILSISFIILLL